MPAPPAPAPLEPPPATRAPAPPPPTPDPRSLPCERAGALVVRKRARMLVVRCVEGGLRELPVALSREVFGAKRARGDLRSPEGEYRVAAPARKSRFRLFIPIDYPSRADADRALAEHRISRAVHAAIHAAHDAGRLPPQDTPLGGWLGLHGEGARWRGDGDLDWTEGCFALRDEDIDWLASHAPLGTPVRIEE
jgi:lipoprotein-anchoring transpeptidase ErfK/SrfK